VNAVTGENAMGFDRKSSRIDDKTLLSTASEMTYIVSSGALNSTHSLTAEMQ